MHIEGESPFAKQEIASSFYALTANFSDTSQTALHARNADSLGNKSANDYALKTEIPSIPSKIDSAVYSDTAAFARNTPVVNNAIYSDTASIALSVSTSIKMDSAVFCDTAAFARNITIQDSSISTTKLTESAVTSIKIMDGTVTTNDIANNAITTVKILDSAITSAKISAGAITANMLPSSTSGSFTVNGSVTANSYLLPSARIKYYCFDATEVKSSFQGIDWYIEINRAHPSTAAAFKAANFIPFNPPNGSILKKITVALYDDSPNTTPNIAVCISEKRCLAPGESGWGMVIRHPWYGNTIYGIDTESSSINGNQVLEINTNFTFDTTYKKYFLMIAHSENTTPGTTYFIHAILEIEESSL